jgi:natural product precursor
MKKQIKKLNLNKRTISNLNKVEMNRMVGGAISQRSCWGPSECRCGGGGGGGGQTQNGNTCAGHNTCNAC